MNKEMIYDGKTYVAVTKVSCAGCAFHDERHPYLLAPGCFESDACDGPSNDGLSIIWVLKE